MQVPYLKNGQNMGIFSVIYSRKYCKFQIFEPIYSFCSLKQPFYCCNFGDFDCFLDIDPLFCSSCAFIPILPPPSLPFEPITFVSHEYSCDLCRLIPLLSLLPTFSCHHKLFATLLSASMPTPVCSH